MYRFKLLSGSFSCREHNKIYEAGDVFTYPTDLRKVFTGMFECVEDSPQKNIHYSPSMEEGENVDAPPLPITQDRDSEDVSLSFGITDDSIKVVRTSEIKKGRGKPLYRYYVINTRNNKPVNKNPLSRKEVIPFLESIPK